MYGGHGTFKNYFAWSIATLFHLQAGLLKVDFVVLWPIDP